MCKDGQWSGGRVQPGSHRVLEDKAGSSKAPNLVNESMARTCIHRHKHSWAVHEKPGPSFVEEQKDPVCQLCCKNFPLGSGTHQRGQSKQQQLLYPHE